jgi:hypothetical protein
MTSTPGSYYLYPGTPSPSWWNAPTNPQSIGANTSEQGYGWGVPGFGQAPIQIDPSYLEYLKGQTTGERGSYIPGSGSFNGWNLSQPGLVGTVGGVANQNLRYGQGGTGDPTTGREPQTPEEWLNGPKAFTWQGNMGQTAATKGLDYIANLFGRPDAGTSGISTAAWSAPDSYWQGLAQAVQAGTVQASDFGLKALAAKGHPVNPPGGAVTISPTGQVTGGGTGGTGAAGSTQNALASIAASQAADQAARLAYTSWQMRTGDEQLAMQKAQQAWTQTFQEKQAEASALGTYGGQQTQQAQQQAFAQEMSRAQFQFQQDQAELAQRLAEAGLTGTYQGQATMAKLQQDFQQKMTELQARMTEAGLTGTYNGQQTQQAQQQAWSQGFQQQQADRSTGMGLLQLQSSLSGPRDWAKYWQLSASAPQGMTSALQSLAGQYNFAPGGQGTPGAATLQSRTADLLSGGQLGQGGQQQTAQPTAGGDPAQSGTVPNPWQFNLQNYARMAPSLQQGVLGGLEASGLYGPDVEAQLRAAAPRYTGPSTAQVGF